MVRRVSMPSADDLFRPTAPEGEQQADPDDGAQQQPADRQPSGRVRHDEKMTVYVTAEELLDIEAARLALRSRHGLAVDRGRLVRTAVALALAELETDGEESRLLRRLADQ